MAVCVLQCVCFLALHVWDALDRERKLTSRVVFTEITNRINNKNSDSFHYLCVDLNSIFFSFL